MAVSVETAARVLFVGKDPAVVDTLASLFGLDSQVDVVGQARSLKTAVADRRPDVIVHDATSSIEARQARADADRIAPGTKLLFLDEIRDLTIGQAIEIVRDLKASAAARHLRVVGPPKGYGPLNSLSPRELDVVRLLAEGLSNKEISSRLELSDKTVKNHISHILAKMSLSARTQIAVLAIRTGLV